MVKIIKILKNSENSFVILFLTRNFYIVDDACPVERFARADSKRL